MALTPEGTPYVESTDLVANYPAASLSLADRVDLVGVLPFADAAARTAAIPTPTDGQFTYLQDTNSTEFYNGSAFEAIGGKILQVVRATDTTDRTTTSTSFVDVTGMSVTISPTKSDSAVLIVASFLHEQQSGATRTEGKFQITDSSNNAISGAENIISGINNLNSFHFRSVILMAYATPATTSAVSYKLKFLTNNSASTVSLLNDLTTGQMYAIEVSA
jgi:hypothetical protein